MPVETLLTEVWGPEYAGEIEHVKHYIWTLRSKIEADPGDPKHIITERGFGYRFGKATLQYGENHRVYLKGNIFFQLQEIHKGNPNDWNKAIIAEFRADGGKVGGRFAGQPLALLHTVGAKSGQPRVRPVACMKDGNRYVIIASKGGAPVNPDWYYNVVANPPFVTVEYGVETFQARATVATEPERTRLYNKMAAERPPAFWDYRPKPHTPFP